MTKARRYALWSAAAALALGTATTLWLARWRSADRDAVRRPDKLAVDSDDARVIEVRDAAR